MALRLQPDALETVVAYLKASTELQALVSQRVSSSLPGQATFPRVEVRDVNAGRQVIPRQLRETVVDIFSWADTRPVAYDVAQVVDAALMEMVGGHGGVVVSHVRVLTAPGWFPDPNTNRPGFRATYGVTAHP